MPKLAKPISLEERAEAIKRDRGETVPVNDIAVVVGSLVANGSADNDVHSIADELKELLDYIGSAKTELKAMQANSLTKRDIPSAHEQLDAVVATTEDAAGTIMDAAEAVGEVAEFLKEGPHAERLHGVSMELFQASSFQDLTGQRITKVTSTLRHLEERLAALAGAIGDQYVAPEPEEDIERDDAGVVVNDEDLLHGPQLEGEGNSQDEIDALLASFD